MIEVITNILSHWQQYLALCTGAVVVGLIGLLKAKDKQIGNLKVQVLLNQTATKIQYDDSQVEVHQSHSEELKKELQDEERSSNLPVID